MIYFKMVLKKRKPISLNLILFIWRCIMCSSSASFFDKFAWCLRNSSFYSWIISLLFLGSCDSTVRLWEMSSQKSICICSDTKCATIAFETKGRFLAVGGRLSSLLKLFYYASSWYVWRNYA
jgi:WD40 repeat protein